MHFKEQLRSEGKRLFHKQLKFQVFVCFSSFKNFIIISFISISVKTADTLQGKGSFVGLLTVVFTASRD